MHISNFFIGLTFIVFSSSAYTQIYKNIDEIYKDFSDSPGAAVAIYEDGSITFSNGYGIANMDYKIPIRSNTVFDTGSISKQFTAACILLLEQQGKLSIDDPIQKFLPEMPQYNGEVVRIRNLINHTSGLRDYVEIMVYAGNSFNNIFTEEMGLDIMSRQMESNFIPGEKFMYNNGGYLLLAIIVRRASGMSIGQFAAKHIFEPLGMKSTFILENPNRIIKNGATGYTRLKKGDYEKLHYLNVAIGGDGQVYTTVEDLHKWDNNFYDPKVGGNALLKFFSEPGILNNGDTTNYSAGLFIEKYKGYRIVQHTGSWGGFVGGIFRLPDLKKTVVILSNNRFSSPHIKIYQIIDMLLPKAQLKTMKRVELKPHKPNKRLLKKYEGLFEVNGEPHRRLLAYIENDSLRVKQYWNQKNFILIPTAEGHFYEKKDPYHKFDFDQTNYMLKIEERVSSLETKRTRPFVPLTDLSKYEGEYYSKEVGSKYVINQEEMKLKVLRNEKEIYSLDQVSEHVFGQNLLGMQFSEYNGQVQHFLLQDRRIRNLKFIKIK